MLKKRINADDFGISKGVNQAITDSSLHGIVNATSVMVNMPYAFDGLQQLQKIPHFSIGLHLNLTNGKALSPPDEIPLLTDKKGYFKNGFLKLFLLGLIFPKRLKKQAYIEAEKQLQALLNKKISVGHLDSHRHIHMIPALFAAALQCQKKYNIPHIRIINENMVRTIRSTPKAPYLTDGGLIKYAVLIACFFCNKMLFCTKTKTYFFSILNTCKITPDKLKKVKVPACYDTIEIAIHPGNPDIDRNSKNIPDQNILSPYRTAEFKTTMTKEILNWPMR